MLIEDSMSIRGRKNSLSLYSAEKTQKRRLKVRRTVEGSAGATCAAR